MSGSDPEHALILSGDSNAAFTQGLAVSIFSALTHLSSDCAIVVYILDCGLPEGAVDRLTQVARRARGDIQVRPIQIDLERLKALPNQSFFPSVVYARLFAPDLVADGTKRAVCLDGDMLVRRDIAELFTLNLDGAPVAATRDFNIASPSMDTSRPYFNAGLLVLDIPTWHEERLSDRVLAYVMGNNDLKHAEQDALNAVISSWRLLDPSWNLQLGGLVKDSVWDVPQGWTTRAELASLHRRLKRKAVILHFNGRKPWFPSHGPVPSSWRWAVCLVHSGWLPPVRSGVWFGVWLWRWARYTVGTARRRVRLIARTPVS